MQLTTGHREEISAGFSGNKHHYLSCHITFTNEERAIIDERGLYDRLSILVPADTPPPTLAGNFLSKVMRGVGIVLVPLGLLFSCVQSVRPDKMPGAGPTPFLMLFGGAALLVAGLWRGRQADNRQLYDRRTLTLRTLMSNPDFIVYAPTIGELRETEASVREKLAELMQQVRANTAVPEQNTYEI